MALMRTLEAPAVVRGAAVAVAVSLPASLLSLVVVRGGDTNVVFAFLVVVLAGLAAGGYVAARRAPAAPLSNGMVAALVAFALIQGAGLLRQAATGGSFSVSSLAFAAFLASCCGLLGGAAASRRWMRTPPIDPDSSGPHHGPRRS